MRDMSVWRGEETIRVVRTMLNSKGWRQATWTKVQLDKILTSMYTIGIKLGKKKKNSKKLSLKVDLT